MKKLAISTLLILALISGCRQLSRNSTHFSTSDKQLTIKTSQEKGLGFMYYFGAIHSLRFEDSIQYEVIVPSDLKDVKYAFEVIDYNILGYQRTIASSKKANKYYTHLISESRIDTSNLLSYKDNSICILEGIMGKDTVYIVDQNNNKDFRDDTVRNWKNIDPYSKNDLLKVDYLIYNNREYVTASNWINIGLWGGSKRYFASQYYTAHFEIDTSNYKIELFIDDTRFNFMDPQIALISHNSTVKDTIIEADVIKIGEVLKLNEGYYRFAELTNDGSFLTLIKEENFDSKIGLQPGMIAPDFTARTVGGDTIGLKQYFEKPVLVANISGCTPSSYEVFKTILEKTKGRLNVVGMGSGVDNDFGGIVIDVEDNFNKDIYDKYRKAYSSYNCYLINTDGRIIDRFTLFAWGANLASYIN